MLIRSETIKNIYSYLNRNNYKKLYPLMYSIVADDDRGNVLPEKNILSLSPHDLQIDLQGVSFKMQPKNTCVLRHKHEIRTRFTTLV
jgi:hypothetical protein